MSLILLGSFALRIQIVYRAEYKCVNQVMANPERLPKTAERIVEDFSWVQWDGHTQRLYYLTHKVTHTNTLIWTAVLVRPLY